MQETTGQQRQLKLSGMLSISPVALDMHSTMGSSGSIDFDSDVRTDQPIFETVPGNLVI